MNRGRNRTLKNPTMLNQLRVCLEQMAVFLILPWYVADTSGVEFQSLGTSGECDSDKDHQSRFENLAEDYR
jgi:hypothetical protein